MFVKFENIERWFPFNFVKFLRGRHFVVGGEKNFKLLPDIYFLSGSQKIVFLSVSKSLHYYCVLVIKLI